MVSAFGQRGGVAFGEVERLADIAGHRSARHAPGTLRDLRPVAEHRVSVASLGRGTTGDVDRGREIGASAAVADRELLVTGVLLLPGQSDWRPRRIEPTGGVGQRCHMRVQARVDPRGGISHILRMHRQTWGQLETLAGGDRGQGLDLRPRAFGIHVIRGDGADPTEVVHTTREQTGDDLGSAQIRWSLDPNARSQEDPSGGDRREVGVFVRVGSSPGGRVRLGPEVLDQHLLDVSVLASQAPDVEQGGDEFVRRLADPHQDPGGERDPQPPGVLDHAQPNLRVFVR